MATQSEIAEAVAILTGGRALEVGVKAARTGYAAVPPSRMGKLRVLGRGGRFVGRQLITKNPWGVAALLAYEGYIHRDEIIDTAQELGATMQEAAEFYEEATGQPPYRGGPALGMPFRATTKKMKKSTFGKAVKAGMQWLKRGGKGATGAPKGKYPAGAFSKATKAAGLASPTKSKIGKGKTVIKKLARVLKAKYYHGPAATKYLKTKKRPSL